MSTPIDSRITLGAPLENFTEEQIKIEPMFYEADGEFALLNGGPITRSFIDGLTRVRSHRNAIIDTRVHFLIPEWHPATPGYHHDAIAQAKPRNLYLPEFAGFHAMAMINGAVCPTSFALGQCARPKVVAGKSWNPVIRKLVEQGKLTLRDAPSNQVVWYHWETFHEATAARAVGWRWFGRAYFDTGFAARNEIRHQSQVFLKIEE